MGFHPYLNFGTSCREAFTRYHEVFGGELVLLSMADMPGVEVVEGQEHLVMHAALKVDDGLLMASDTGNPDAGPVQWCYINHSCATADDARRIFDALAVGGQVEIPLEATFWSPAFGALTDRWGVQWMISADPT